MFSVHLSIIPADKRLHFLLPDYFPVLFHPFFMVEKANVSLGHVAFHAFRCLRSTRGVLYMCIITSNKEWNSRLNYTVTLSISEKNEEKLSSWSGCFLFLMSY